MDLPLLPPRDIKKIIIFSLFKQMSEEDMMDRILKRHLLRKKDINHSMSQSSDMSMEDKILEITLYLTQPYSVKISFYL